MKVYARIGVMALTALLLALAAAGCATQAAPATEDFITVTGFGKARSDPDMATVSVGVNVSNEDITQAVEESNRVIDRITEAIKALGVEESDIHTTNFSIWGEDQWDPETGQRKQEKLYRVDSTVQVTLRDVALVSELLEASILNGANTIYGLNFSIQDTNALAAEARSAAIADARMRAETIAQELGVTLGEVSKAIEVSGGQVYPMFEAGYGIGGGGGAPPISEGTMTVTNSMEVTFEILR